VSEKWQFRYVVSIEICQLKALALAKEQGINGFKASRGWIIRIFFLHETNSVQDEKLVFPSGFQMHMKRKYCFQKYIINVQ
jgi:hypothetical protein